MACHIRRSIEIEGIVQGVGFRPFVYQLAQKHRLSGWVLNDARGVKIEVEGDAAAVDAFVQALQTEHPPLAVITSLQTREQPAAGGSGFEIRQSVHGADARAQIAPDTHVCDDCLRELFDPADRRYRYPFINCTNCGPRYTIIEGIPYDRPKTTMADFPMCDACRAEYENPGSRRFHAQPNACPDCGPQLRLTDADRLDIAGDPLKEAVRLLSQGAVVAIKGLGGYHLAVDATNDAAVAKLRRRKARDEKPFALMAFDLERVRRFARFDAIEERLLTGPEHPIVLLRQRPGHSLSPLVAPDNRYFGVMLPYTPLHHLLLESFDALVMTSANFSDEPILYRDDEAAERLRGVADAWLTHNRRIHVRADDSIARVMAGQALLIRRARGYVPRGILLPRPQTPVLAVGAELKNTLCLTRDDRAYLSQHIGDLKNAGVLDSLDEIRRHLERVLEVQPRLVAHDLHPDYLSTRFAEEFAELPKLAVQHHHAHLASCLAEHGHPGPAIGVIFDGIGLGEDGTIWGGEFLVGDLASFRRAGHLRSVPMPGGDAATREPWRMAASYLQHAYGDDWPRLPLVERRSEDDIRLLRQMMAKGLNAPLTSSCGRLFDAVAALAGLREEVSYEGQAALGLEMAISGPKTDRLYGWDLAEQNGTLIIETAPLIRDLVDDVLAGVDAGRIACRFHLSLARIVVAVCRELRTREGLNVVVLSGGVFQNRFLTETISSWLQAESFEVLRHSLVPPNDGGLALGQAVVAGARYEEAGA
ncbi:carbamoyltransferase HypF [Geothermobacter ehrlichii]|nr:carbamoyltransferase HypF [Geothermobacter ehrlichii]